MNTETKLNVLLEELKLTNQTIEQFLGNQFNVLNISLLLIGAASAFIVSNQNEEIKYLIKFLPFLVFGIASLFGYHLQRTLALQGYKKYLEQKINSLCNENLVCYAHIGLKKFLLQNLFSIYSATFYPMIYIISCIIAYKYSSDNIFIEIIFYLFMGIIYLVAFTKIYKETDYTEKVSIYINSNVSRNIDQIIDSLN